MKYLGSAAVTLSGEINVLVDSCFFRRGNGAINLDTRNGNLFNLHITNCSVVDMPYWREYFFGFGAPACAPHLVVILVSCGGALRCEFHQPGVVVENSYFARNQGEVPQQAVSTHTAAARVSGRRRHRRFLAI
jgi:hypothetical protein